MTSLRANTSHRRFNRIRALLQSIMIKQWENYGARAMVLNLAIMILAKLDHKRDQTQETSNVQRGEHHQSLHDRYVNLSLPLTLVCTLIKMLKAS